VSAEAFGVWNKKSDFKAREVEKSEEVRQKIMDRLKQSFLFSSLSENEMHIVVGAMEERKHKNKEAVITQGEDGKELFIVEHGTLSCFKQFSGQA
jgi:cAMP-dependent protein kinase regulator